MSTATTSTVISATLFVVLGLSLLLAAVSWLLPRRTAAHYEGFGPGTKLFLVGLRLAIGWHFMVEGLHKFEGAWSGEPYLREASGPLAPSFRNLAGDRLVDQLTVTEGNIAPELAVEWEAYLAAFESHFRLDAEQAKRAEHILAQAKSNAATWLSSRPRKVEKISQEPPPLLMDMTMPERIKEYQALQAKVRHIDDNLLPDKGPAAWDQWKKAKADLAKWRGGMQRDLALLTREFKHHLRMLLLDLAKQALPADQQKKVDGAEAALRAEEKKKLDASGPPDPADWEAVVQVTDGGDEKLMQAYRQAFYDVHFRPLQQGDKSPITDPQTRIVIDEVIEKQWHASTPGDPLAAALLGEEPWKSAAVERRVSRPVASWKLLDWSDAIVKYGITSVGVLLLLGLFTRLSCVLGAGFLLMFFVAMPPLPELPEGLRAEGHYLYINKNVIEMLALLALATTRSGRWLGLDALIHLLNPWRQEQKTVTME